MDEDPDPTDWTRYIINQFIVGAIVGGGLGLLTGLSAGRGISWPWILIPALILGILAAMYGDRFWETFWKWIFSFPWW